MQTFLRRGLPLTVLVLALPGSVVLTLFVAAMVREYADTSSPGSLQGLRLAALPGAVLVVLALAAAAVLRTRVAAGLVGGVVVLVLVGSAVAGEWATRAKEAAQPRTAPCSLEDVDVDKGGSLDEKARGDAARAQEALDALDHPVPFTGGSSSGIGGCTAPLATTDMPAVLAFYRDELPSAGWTIVADDDARLVATSGDLTLTVELDAEGVDVQVTVAVP